MPLWRQTYLNSSSELKLQITATRVLQIQNECFVFRLPDEILVQIFDNSTNHDIMSTVEDQASVNTSDEEKFDYGVKKTESFTPIDTRSQRGYEELSSEDMKPNEAGYYEKDNVNNMAQDTVVRTPGPIYGKATNIPLRLVCKRWQQVYDEIFFRDILLGTSDGSGGLKAARRIQSLLTVLENRRLLQAYPRFVYIDLDKMGEIACRNVVKIVNLCKGIRILNINTGLKKVSTSRSTLPLLEATKPLKLDTLHITCPSLHLLKDLLDLSSIKELSFDRYGPGIPKSAPFASWIEDDEGDPSRFLTYKTPPITEVEVEELFPRSKDHTWSATSLCLSDPICYPIITEHIVRMPARLQKLSLTELDCCIVSREYNLVAVQAVIDIHRDTLQSITLSRIPHENKSMPDFTQFPELRSLTMSAFDIMQIEKPASALQKLSGTPLENLCLDIAPVDQNEPISIDQQIAWVAWLTEFASVKQSKYPESKLEEVFVSTLHSGVMSFQIAMYTH